MRKSTAYPLLPTAYFLPALLALSLFLAPHALAQQTSNEPQGHSNTSGLVTPQGFSHGDFLRSPLVMGLTPTDFQTITRLTTEALTHSSLTLQAKLDLTTAQQNEELATRLLDNLSLNAAAGVASNSGYEQINPTFSISASFDVIGFATPSPSQLPELQAKLAEAKHQVHQQVLAAFLTYRQALDQAHLAADALDIAKATLKVQGVRLKAGEITDTDYLASRQQVEQAQVDMAAANYQIVLSKSALAQSVGISVESLNRLLKDSEASP